MSKQLKKPPICEAAKVLQGLQSHGERKNRFTLRPHRSATSQRSCLYYVLTDETLQTYLVLLS
jgi:hypothetical protein